MELSVDGRSVFAATGGREPSAAAPLVLLLHGAGMDHTTWVLQTRFLAHHGQAVMALDLPGHGRSEGPALSSIEGLADWVAAVIEAAGRNEAALVGHSMGSAIALTAAARHPALVRRLALLGAATRFAVHPDLMGAARAGAELAPQLMAFWGLGAHAQLGGHVAPGLWLTQAAQRLIEQGLHRSLAVDLEACSRWKAEAHAKAVRAPALVIAGSADRMTTAREARAVAGLIAGARLEILEGAGHMMMLEQPDAVVDRLARFLETEPAP